MKRCWTLFSKLRLAHTGQLNEISKADGNPIMFVKAVNRKVVQFVIAERLNSQLTLKIKHENSTDS